MMEDKIFLKPDDSNYGRIGLINMTQQNELKDRLINALKTTVQKLLNTKTQCSEMLQLVDNISINITKDKHKSEHMRQQDYWASNLVIASQHLLTLNESIDQLNSGKLKLSKNIKETIFTIIEQAEELATRIGRIYEQIISSIAPIEDEVKREIALIQKQH